MTRTELLNHLKQKVLKTPAIIAAFEKIDRKDFVPEEFTTEAYEDAALPIDHGATISQPFTVAFMLEALETQAGQKILDLGSGSGWTTALLSAIVGEKGRVIGVEIVPELVQFGRENLAKYDFSQATIRRADRVIGAPEESPYDRILVSAAAEEKIPDGLILQLKIGGIMIIPIKNSVWKVTRVSDKDIKKQEFPGFVFVPLKE